MSLRTAGRFILATMTAVALSAIAAPPVVAQQGGEPIAKTVEEHQAKIRVYNAKAARYRKEAEDARAKAARYRNARDAKQRKISTPAHRQMIEDLEQMAQDADELANDADRVAFYHQRQIDAMTQ